MGWGEKGERDGGWEHGPWSQGLSQTCPAPKPSTPGQSHRTKTQEPEHHQTQAHTRHRVMETTGLVPGDGNRLERTDFGTGTGLH